MNTKLAFLAVLLLMGLTLSGCVAWGGYGYTRGDDDYGYGYYSYPHGHYYFNDGYPNRYLHHRDWDGNRHRR